MKIATFNVNGLRARLPRVLEWLAETKPDVVALQEVKAADDAFPREELEKAGYPALTLGEKGRNGVAILARGPAQWLLSGLPHYDDPQARWIEARIAGVRVVSLYLPNGNPFPGPKYAYKLDWMGQMERRAAALLKTEEPVVLAGDFNICPTDADAARPEALKEDAIAQKEVRIWFRRLVASGWTDALRILHPNRACYSYWDYKAGAFPKNWGMRIDHMLLSPAAADRLEGAGVDREARAAERPSDHAPVWIRLNG